MTRMKLIVDVSSGAGTSNEATANGTNPPPAAAAMPTGMFPPFMMPPPFPPPFFMPGMTPNMGMTLHFKTSA